MTRTEMIQHFTQSMKAATLDEAHFTPLDNVYNDIAHVCLRAVMQWGVSQAELVEALRITADWIDPGGATEHFGGGEGDPL